jgi:hypothetical protein
MAFSQEGLAARAEGLFSANLKKYLIYLFLVFHQIFVCLVLIHGILANHVVHLFLNFNHEIFGALAVYQMKSE